MDTAQFNRLVEVARKRQDELLKTKGADYTRHSADRLSNFTRNAEAVGVSPLVVWAIYAGKHWDAIMAFIKTGKTESESLIGRFDDLINYLYLLEGLVTEDFGRLRTSRQSEEDTQGDAKTSGIVERGPR